jgi:hypothetical protein
MTRLDGFLVLAVIVIFLVARSLGQELPDAPRPQHWYQKQYEPSYRTWGKVFRDPLLYANVGADLGLALSDAYQSRLADDRGCVDTQHNLYKANIPENIAVLIVSVGWLKLHGPRWVMPMFLVASAVEHGRGIHAAINCR